MFSIACILALFMAPAFGEYAVHHSADSYVRPTCGAAHACAFSYLGEDFAFCDCSDDRQCIIKDGVVFGKVQYHFCDSRIVPTCSESDTAQIIDGLNTIVNCVCPSGTVLTERSGARFVCVKKFEKAYNFEK